MTDKDFLDKAIIFALGIGLAFILSAIYDMQFKDRPVNEDGILDDFPIFRKGEK